MTVKSSINGNQVHLIIEESFNYTVQTEFCQVFKKIPQGADKSYTLDMSKVDLIDSSGLGMLLLLREYAGDDNSDITIIAGNDAKKSLISSNFGQLFKFA